MKKQHLDNAYADIFKGDKEVFALALPVAMLYKYIYNQNETILREKYSLIHSEIDVLAALLFNGKVMTPTSLYDATIFSSGGMTKVLKKLEDKNLISRVPSQEDKRSKLVKIEPQGEKMVEECLVDIIQSDNKIFSILDEQEKKSLKKIFKKLLYSLVEDGL